MVRLGVGEGINQLFSNFLGKTLVVFKRKSYLCSIKRNINNIGIMKQVEERYISLLTDFGFKRIFGSAPNKDLLICFLNSLFNGRQVVKDVKYLNSENVGDIYTDRIAVFKLNHIYTITLLNFNMNEDAFNKEEIRHHVQLCDTATHKIFYDKLEFIYVEIAKFNKSLDELETLYDKWLYALKNLYKLTQRPKALCDKVFDRLFEEAEIAKFTPQEQREYEASKMAYRDIKNSIDTAKREGKEEGLAEGMEKGLAEGMEKGLAEGMEKGLAEGMEKGMNQRSLEIARKMLANGMDAATVMEITGLSAEQLELK